VKDASVKGSRTLSLFPTGAFVAIVAAVCLGLALTAGYDFLGLAQLRVLYLQNSATRVFTELETKARGPDKRPYPEFWQSLFVEKIGAGESDVAFLALLNESGDVLASEGARFARAFAGPGGFRRIEGTEIYIYESELPNPQSQGAGRGGGMGAGMGMGHRAVPRRLRIGIYSSSVDFIRWQATVHLAVSGVAVLTLIALAWYFLRTLNRLLQLKAREESARHLTALGAMAATLAHEIRNPLGAMKGLTQLAQEDLPGDHKIQSLMSTVVREAERLEQLVSDLLTFARPRDPQISRFDFQRLLSDVKAGLQPKLDAAGIKLDLEPGPDSLLIDADEGGLRQVLLNILLNAADATPAGGTITVRTRLDQKARVLTAEVDDSGPGLDDSDPEELFQPFATTKTKGTGLGLPISRQIAEGLGGSLTLANRPGGGARCTLTLPIRAAQHPTAKTPSRFLQNA
jgi:signal transduction histidine kinase